MASNKFNTTFTKSVSVLVPVLNENLNLAPTIERLLRALSITVEDYEIIIINDGSTDGTGEIADKLARENGNIKVVHNSKCMGLGYVYAEGVKTATKNYFVYIPGDNTWPYRSFVELLGNLGKADIVTSFSSNPGVRPFGRRVVSKLYTKTLNLLFNRDMHYYNGLTIYPMEFLSQNPTTTFGFGFQAEALLKAIFAGYSFIEISIPIDERTAGGSKAVNMKNILSVAKTVFSTFMNLIILNKGKSLKRRFKAKTSEAINANSNTSVEELGFRPISKQDYRDKTAISKPLKIVITGGSSGIGEALVEQLVGDGHELYVCARDVVKLNRLKSRVNIVVKSCDISKEDEVIDFADFIKNQTNSIDVLINCAGGFGAIGPFEKTNSTDWLETMKVNVFGTYLMIKYFLPLLKEATHAKIINFSGGGAFSPFPNYSAYASSKAAVIRLTETVAVELAPFGITVNAIAPGIVATPAHLATIAAGEELAGKLQFKRTELILKEGGASLDNVVDCVRMLLSETSNDLTGKTISANFDPWKTNVFQKNISKISRSDLYTLSRVNIVNLPEGDLRNALAAAWSTHGTQI